uniref:Putative ovule protein n=1 Tax=Solanum chacoense TaxID=4108 RepID=A0A0V0HCX8_SOLCH
MFFLRFFDILYLPRFSILLPLQIPHSLILPNGFSLLTPIGQILYLQMLLILSELMFLFHKSPLDLKGGSCQIQKTLYKPQRQMTCVAINTHLLILKNLKLQLWGCLKLQRHLLLPLLLSLVVPP